MTYLSKKAPKLLDMRDSLGTPPVMVATWHIPSGGVHVVRHLARLGCDLRATNKRGKDALTWAVQLRKTDIATLLTDIASAGGWRQYVAARRMAYVRIRHEVSKTYAVLDEGHDDRALLHFLFGRNRVAVGAAAPASHGGPRLEEAADNSSEKVKTGGNAQAGAASKESEAVRAMSVKQLKAAAKERGVSLVGCLEKADIIAAVLAADAAKKSHGERREEVASGGGAGKAKELLELPDVVFQLVCRMLET